MKKDLHKRVYELGAELVRLESDLINIKKLIKDIKLGYRWSATVCSYGECPFPASSIGLDNYMLKKIKTVIKKRIKAINDELNSL